MSDSIAEGLAEIGRGIDAANIREWRLRGVLADLVAALEYTGALEGERGGEGCHCPLEGDDDLEYCTLCVGRSALKRACGLLGYGDE